jgi:hypothetical protein
MTILAPSERVTQRPPQVPLSSEERARSRRSISTMKRPFGASSSRTRTRLESAVDSSVIRQKEPEGMKISPNRRELVSASSVPSVRVGSSPKRAAWARQAASISGDASLPTMSKPRAKSGRRKRPLPHIGSRIAAPAARSASAR